MTAPGLGPDLAHVDTWLFDLDDTLYPPECELMALVNERMTAFVARQTGLPWDEARALQKRYYREHGTTLAGLMAFHRVDPAAFIAEVQDVAMDTVAPDPALRAALSRLPGRRLVFTNAGSRYAEKVLARLGLADLFEDVFHIEAADYIPKPQPACFARMLARHAVAPAGAAFFEDFRAQPRSGRRPGHDHGAGRAPRLDLDGLLRPPPRRTPGPVPRGRPDPPGPLTAMTDAAALTVSDLQAAVDAAWEAREALDPQTEGLPRLAVETALDLLDSGRLRVAEKLDGEWITHQWLKKAVLLSFRLAENRAMNGGWDKVPLKFGHLSDEGFREAGFRAVPGSVVRRGAYIGRNAVLMPSFVNIGAYVGEGTMVDTWATVGSCAQIGKNVHLSGGVGIGGVLEPLQANPTIIEDGCFIGARSEVAEGVVVEEGAVLAMGVFISASTKIVDRATGEIFRGRVPAYSVVVPGTLPAGNGPSLACAVIVKRVDAQTRAKTGVNDLLRD
jgi:2,3,4,5-tetrahydropyridine-2-carboxylate N-succinyltransferase